MIDMQVRTEAGDIVARGTRGLEWTDALQNVDSVRFPCLSGLLPYADTVFNSRQAERLRLEASSHSARIILGEAAALEIEKLCTQVENGSHLYLWFVGD